MKIRAESLDCTFLFAIQVQHDFILQRNPNYYYLPLPMLVACTQMNSQAMIVAVPGQSLGWSVCQGGNCTQIQVVVKTLKVTLM